MPLAYRARLQSVLFYVPRGPPQAGGHAHSPSHRASLRDLGCAHPVSQFPQWLNRAGPVPPAYLMELF